MVRFCNNCKRAIDDLDKFCRSCGHDSTDSIDYYTYYKDPIKEENKEENNMKDGKGQKYLSVVFQKDEGQRQAVQYLIDRYNKNRDKKSLLPYPNINIISQEDVTGREMSEKEKEQEIKIYDIAIHPFIPDILSGIESSKDGIIRLRLSDVAKEMGDKFIDKKPETIYAGLKCVLFDHKIIVDIGSLKDVDPITKKNIKILKMRMKMPDDKLRDDIK